MKFTKAIIRFWNQYNCVGRLFWTATMALSFFGMSIFCYYTFQRYFSDPVGMTVDTEYIQWNFSFPAVSICLIKGKFSSPLLPLIDNLNITTFKGSKTNFMRLVHTCMFENSLRFGVPQLKKCGELESVYGINVEKINAMVLPQDCKEILDFLYFNNELLSNCSNVLKFHKTEIGYCFIFNSIIDNDLSFGNLKSKYNYFSKAKKLSMRLRGFKLWRYTVQVHSPEEIPFFNSISKEMYTSEILHSYSVEIVMTDLDASKKSIRQRGCRFPHEKLEGSPFHYSFSTCMSFLKIQLELKECNCTHPSSPEIYRAHYCDISGKICLLNGNIYGKVFYVAMKEDICVPSCTEQILGYSGQSELGSKDNDSSTDISIEVLNTPTSRFKRSVIRTKLDLAVSIAGLAGLFFGASVLNFVEIIYYLISDAKLYDQ